MIYSDTKYKSFQKDDDLKVEKRNYNYPIQMMAYPVIIKNLRYEGELSMSPITNNLNTMIHDYLEMEQTGNGKKSIIIDKQVH